MVVMVAPQAAHLPVAPQAVVLQAVVLQVAEVQKGILQEGNRPAGAPQGG